MLRLIQIGNSLPVSFPVDPTSVFQPGQIGQLKVIGNEIVCGISDGTAPFGIIDDINILQPIKKLKTYEFISYKGVIMYKLDNNVIDKLKKLNYDIKYIYDFENCNDILYEKQKNTVNEIYKHYNR